MIMNSWVKSRWLKWAGDQQVIDLVYIPPTAYFEKRANHRNTMYNKERDKRLQNSTDNHAG